MNETLRRRMFLAGLFVLSSSLFILQILMVRLTRVVFVFDLQFVMLSSAILGMAVGALLVSLFLNRLGQDQFRLASAALALAYAACSPLPFLVLRGVDARLDLASTLLFFGLLFASYALGGGLLALAFRYFAPEVGVEKVYAADMAGSALGALLAVWLLNQLGHGAIAFYFASAVLAAVLFAAWAGRSRAAKALAVGAALCAIFSNPIGDQFHVRAGPGGEPISSALNSFAQVDTYSPRRIRMTQGDEVGRGYPEDRIPLDTATLKVDRLSTLYVNKFRTPDDREALNYYISSFPFLVGRYRQAVVLGAGAGNEVTAAVHNGSEKVYAVEIDPLVVHAVEAAFPQTIYHDPHVETVLDEGRSFVAQSGKLFDLIYIPTSKSFGGVGAAAYAMTANYLYTRETLRIYLEHLEVGGVLSITDWKAFAPQFLKTLAVAARGYDGKVALVQTPNYYCILFKKGGFSLEEIERIDTAATSLGFRATMLDDLARLELEEPLPWSKVFGNAPEPRRVSGHEAMHGRGKLEELVKHTSVITNDRPYIANMVGRLLFTGSAETPRTVSKTIALFLGGCCALYLMFVTGFVAASRSLGRRTWTIASLFTFLGVGFVTVELYMVEKLALFLGHPMWSLSFALVLFLIFGGVGSLVSRRIDDSKATWVALGMGGVLLSYTLVVPLLTDHGYDLWFAVRFLIGGGLVAIPAFLSGVVFTLALRKCGKLSERLVPWAIGLDGFASFIAGILFNILALLAGLSAGLYVGVACYLFSAICLRVGGHAAAAVSR